MGFLRCFALAAVAALTACAPEPGPRPGGGSIGRDVGGPPTYRTAWTAIEPHELLINIADLEEAALSNAERRGRDNRLVQQRVRLDGGSGRIFLEHSISGYYNERSTRNANDPASSKKGISRYYGKIGRFDYEESRKVYTYGERGGWVHRVRNRVTDRTCIFAQVAFLSDQAKLHGSVTDERYDTVVRLRDCSRKRSLNQTEAFLNRMKIVPPEYNRGLRGR